MVHTIQSTTPDLLFIIKDRDLTGCTVRITFTQRKKAIVVTSDEGRVHIDADSSGTLLYVRLTQEETMAMKQGTFEVQAHWIDNTGYSEATYPPLKMKQGRILYPKEIKYVEEG